MDNVSFISDLKLRASYGILGNNEVGGDYPGFSNFGTGVDVSNYDINGTGNRTVTGFEQGSTGNPKLKMGNQCSYQHRFRCQPCRWVESHVGMVQA